MNKDIKIDLVCLWVDGNDIEWQKKKNSFLDEKIRTTKDSSSECRYISNDELKYALRSIEKNLPWLNKIYIITDNQIPTWLNLNNEKIKIIDHKEIFNPEDLPNFNSIAIESNIIKIKELSEHFLLSNDDCFVFRPLEKSFFYNENNLPIFRMKEKLKLEKISKSQYGYNIKYTYKKINDKYRNVPALFSHHNIDSYCKSDIKKCLEEYRADIEKLSKEKFRTFGSFERTGWAYWALANNRGILKKINKINIFGYILAYLKLNKPVDALYFGIHKKNIEKKLKLFKPGLFCINDGLKGNKENRFKTKETLEKIFPNKSSFEI